MLPIAILHFTWPIGFWIALVLAILAIALAALRSIDLPPTTRLLLAIGILLLAVAAGGPMYRGERTPEIAVMVDISPSTRGAGYFDRDRLRTRIAQLLGARAYRLYSFSDSRLEINSQHPIVEQRSQQTNFTPPPDADAVLLFSDARFDPPAAAPQTFAVVDPLLDGASDAAITTLAINNDDVTIALRNHQGISTDPRRLTVEGVLPSATLPIGETLGDGEFIFHAKRDPNADAITARAIAQDGWPENDQMRILSPPTSRAARWWVSANRPAPDATWRTVPPQSFPLDAEPYLAPSVIVLDDVPADAISTAAQQRIAQYVRDLGGSLIITGGEHAFGAGGYFGTILESLSPLSSAPPSPTRHWILLTDSSGSMAGALPGDPQTKWQHAVDALLRALPTIPTNDLVSTGSFAREVRWWSNARSPEETRRMTLPPADVAPNGPTNLQPALEQIAARADQMPTEVLILSDGDATIADPENLGKNLSAKKIHVNLLDTGADPAADNPVARVVRAAGGQQFREADPTRWSSRVRELVRAAMPELIARGSAMIEFDRTTNLPSRMLNLWNRTWPKSDSESLATIRDNGTETTGAAQWNVGAGRVISLTFPATAQEISTLTERVARPPRNPRFSVRRDEGADLHITVDAIDNGNYLNGLALQLSLRDQSDASPGMLAFTQSAPGRYELTTPTPSTSKIATIALAGTVIDRFAIAGRYPQEFDGIGNDRAAMRELAQRTGGRVIEPTDSKPLEIHGAARDVPLTSEVAFAGCALIAIGLIHWRRST